MKSFKILCSTCVLCILMTALTLLSATPASASGNQQRQDRMSAMGKRARAAVARINAGHAKSASTTARAAGATPAPHALAKDNEDNCINDPECGEDEEGDADAIPGGQAELSIAVDGSGQHVVIGYNDTRGFDKNPISVSGVLYSNDGGKTFVDGGQLPSPGNESIGTTLFPQVFGDPDVKYLGNCVFIYSSILITKAAEDADVQTMGVHRSNDCGKTWEGPFEVTSATNPSGILDGDVPQDAADKEFMDVDPDTGRVILSWSNFTPEAPGGVEIRTTYSDNLKHAATPTWSKSAIVAATDSDGQASIPRFAAQQQECLRRLAALPVPRHVLRLRQHRGLRALDGQRPDLAGADRNRRVLHHGPGAGQRPREHLALAGGGQLARRLPGQRVSGLRQQQQRRRRGHRVSEEHRWRQDPVVTRRDQRGAGRGPAAVVPVGLGG